MTQDCSTSLSTAHGNSGSTDRRFLGGIHITGAEHHSAPGMEGMSASEVAPEQSHSLFSKEQSASGTPWGYLYIHNRRVDLFRQQLDAYNLANPDAAHRCFVHYSYKYRQKPKGHGVQKQHQPTVSGLVFLQGTTAELRSFLRENYPQYHLVNDCSTGRPASIANRVMQSFIEVSTFRPESITFLREPFEKFAKDRTRLRILTGPFKGMEGYIIRIDRDRQLVMEFGGYAVAIRGVHNEDFQVAE